MKKLTLFIILLIASINFVNAQGSHYVKGHFRSNGTYVAGYHRTNPNNTINDNYSTSPNVNPYTGKVGTVQPSYSSSYSSSNYSSERTQSSSSSYSTPSRSSYSTTYSSYPSYNTPSYSRSSSRYK